MKKEAAAMSGILEEMTIDDIRALAPNVGVIPIGSTEPHGPALPYGSDSFHVQATCYRAVAEANRRGGRVVCLPPQRISLNNNFHAFPFACRLSVPVFMQVVRDLVLFLRGEGIRRMMIVNGHGGNTDVLRAVQRDLAGTDDLFIGLVGDCDCADEAARALIRHESDHAGEKETSQNLFLRPELVRRDKIGVFPRQAPSLETLTRYPVHFVRPWHRYVPASAGGDAREASAAKGEALIKSAADGLATLLTELSHAPETPAFPY